MISLFHPKKDFLFLSFFVISCQSFHKNPKPSDLSSHQLKEMNQALLHVKKGEFLKAAHIYDQLSQELKGKPIEAMMLFNSGSNYRSVGDCDKSVARYRLMLERSLKQFFLKARGLMEMSYSYECLGDLKASFLSLKDAGDLSSYLPSEVNRMIHPARLSLSYASLGQKKQADKYKSFALMGVLQVKNSYKTQKDISQNLSQSFYFMGKNYISKKYIQADSFFQSFSYHQVYLLQSLFLRDKEWSLKSKEEIESLFNKLHSVLSVSSKSVKKKYKKLIQQSLKEGERMIQREQSLKWKSFYKKQTRKIRPLLV